MLDNISDLREEFNSLPETKLFQGLSEFKHTMRILDDNYNEMMNHYNYMKEDHMFYFKPEEDDYPKYREDINKIERLIHNYTASVYTIIDNTRAFYRHTVAKFNKFDDYEIEADRWFAKNPLARFIYGLRVYFQHYKIPRMVFGFSFTGDNKLQIKYNVKELLEFSNWNSYAKEFLLSCKRDVNLMELFIKYNSTINEFNDWFIKKIEYKHISEKQKVLKKRKEITEAHLDMLPMSLWMYLDLYKRGDLKKPEFIFKNIMPKKMFDNILYLNLDYTKRAIAFLELANRMHPLGPDLNKNILEVFQNYKPNTNFLDLIKK